MKKISLILLTTGIITFNLPGYVASASSCALSELKWALKQFERIIKYEYQEPSWKSRRYIWIEKVNKALKLEDIKQPLIELETLMKWSSFKETWRQRRLHWINSVQNSTGYCKIADYLIELETATLWKAMDERWRSERQRWLVRLNRVSQIN